MTGIIFLKFGGSLITDKTQPYVPRLDKLSELCREIASSAASRTLILGHGSGSFGHTAARQYGTRQGVTDAQGWRGFAEVHFQAARLNRYVMEALNAAGIPAIAFPPSASVTARDGRVSHWEVEPLRRALANGILPVVYGDVVFDEVRGGTILSTEDLFQHLAHQFHPERILLAGLEPGVWADFPTCTHLVEEINPESYAQLRAGVGGAVGADVTGGMESKVEQMLKLVKSVPGLEAVIFSAREAGNLTRALIGERIGTRVAGG
jgi:isopentenyl phosphate kinase